MIYLDYAANTPVLPEVLTEYQKVAACYIGNPNGNHQAGRMAKEKLQEVTKELGELLGVSSKEIIYTSGASEANNLAIKGLVRSYRHVGKHIISTFLEHPSVSATLTWLQEQGYEIDLVAITKEGKVDLEHFKELIRKDTVLISIGMIDGELGTVQPMEEIKDIVKEFPNCHLHVDATQAMGKTKVFMEGIDCITFSPHKYYGLNGCGVLIKKEGVILEPQIHGGTSTTIYRSGTPDLALAAATLKATKLAIKEQENRYQVIVAHYNKLLSFFESLKGVTINSPKEASKYFINLSVEGIKGIQFQETLDKQGVCVSVKSACSVVNTPSRAVFAITKNRQRALGSFRITLSHLTTNEEIEKFQKIFLKCLKELKHG